MESAIDDPYPSLILLAEFANVSTPFIVVNGVVFILLVLLSALISGSEVAFFSLEEDALQVCKDNDTAANKAIVNLLEKPRHLLATILIMNNLVNIAIVTLSTYVTWELVGTKTTTGTIVVILTSIVTFVILFFGEVVPKNIATQQNLRFAQTTSRFLVLLRTIFKPISYLLINVTNIIERNVERKGSDISVDQLNQALEMTAGEDTSKEEKGILKGIVNFSTLSAKQIMQSRIDIMAVDIEDNFHELMDQINKLRFSRIPVFRETLDKIEGVLYIKDLLPHIEKDEDFEWQQVLRPGFFVPENKKIDKLLKNFQEKRVHMAIVVDEYGGTAGLVTMEDVIEEIVGEINDEFDDNEIGINKIDETSFLVEGKTSLNDFCKFVHAEPNVFDDVKGESESLGGLLLELHSKLPRAGEKIEYGPYQFTAIAVDDRKIKRVKVFIDNNKIK